MTAVLDALRRSDPVFGGTGLLVALAVMVALLALVAREDRHGARAPIAMLVGHVALTGLLTTVPKGHGSESIIRVIAVTLLLLSIGRMAFLLFVNSFWIRRFARPVPKIFRDVVQAFIYIGVGLLVLRASGVEPGSLLTTSALLTAVIGLSLQDTLGNLFAGLAIQAQRPFDVGDWIQFDEDPEHIGHVLEINWRATRIRTLRNIEITVPNGALARAPILNYSMPNARVRREVSVVSPFEVSPERAREAMLRGLVDLEGVVTEPPPLVLLDDFTDRGLAFRVVYYIDDFRLRERIASRVREQLWYALTRAGTAIPVPHRTLTLERQKRSYAQQQQPPVALLHKLDFFADLAEEEVEALARRCQRLTFGRNEYVVHAGESDRRMFVIERGRVRIAAPKQGMAPPRTVAMLSPGDFFGEMSLMTGAKRSADAIAEQETSVLALDHATFAPVIERYPGLASRISRVLAERKARLEEFEGDASQSPVKKAKDEDELLHRIRRFFAL